MINEEKAFYRYVGAQIRYYRKAKKLRIVALANAMQISYQQLQKYEIATNRIPAVKILQAAQALDISIRQLMPVTFNEQF